MLGVPVPVAHRPPGKPVVGGGEHSIARLVDTIIVVGARVDSGVTSESGGPRRVFIPYGVGWEVDVFPSPVPVKRFFKGDLVLFWEPELLSDECSH